MYLPKKGQVLTKMKKWSCRVNILFGCVFSDYVVKANTERKARLFAIKVDKKEHGDVSMSVVSCELIS